MRNKLLVLALFGAFASAAQADSKVTIYGTLDVSVDYGKYNKGVSQTRLSNSNLMASRLGFTGVEDLGGGLKANFNLEIGFSPDTGENTIPGAPLFGRGATVGLEGAFGSFDMGRMFAPMFHSHIATDTAFIPYGAGAVVANMEQIGALGRTMTAGFLTNNIRYRTVPTNGITTEWSYSFGSETPGERKSDGRNIGMSGKYVNGPLLLTYGFNRWTTYAAGAKNDTSQTTNMIGARYKLTGGAVGASYLRTTNMTATGGGITGGDAKVWRINGNIAVNGTDQVDLALTRMTENQGRATTGWTIGYVHPLSKRTQLYSYFTALMNNSNGVRGFAAMNGPYAKVDAGYDPKAVSFGVRHGF